MAHELDDISRVLGGIESTLKDFGRRFDVLERRGEQHDTTLDDIQANAERLASDVRYMKTMITEDLKPVTDDVKRWRVMGLGALGVIGIGGSAFGAGILWLLDQVGWIKLP